MENAGMVEVEAMRLWFRVAMRVLTRTLDFAWTGALTMFIVGAVSGCVAGIIHIILGALFSKSNAPVLVLFLGTAAVCGLFGAFCGGFTYAIAGAITSRHPNINRVIDTINRWIFHCGIVGMTIGYLNGVIFLLWQQQYAGRKIDIFNFMSSDVLESCAGIGFFPSYFHGRHSWRAKSHARNG